jgi:hypothetical protein
MDYRTHQERWDNSRIPWIRASDIVRPPLEISAPIRPLYYRAAALMFVYTVLYIAIYYASRSFLLRK